jgi:hypothetical protein
MLKADLGLGSDRHGEFVEGHRQSPGRRLLSSQLVVSAPKVLDERS